MTAESHLPAARPALLSPPQRRDLAVFFGRLALASTWAVRHPTERFAERPLQAGLERLYYQADDGWEAPLWRLPPAPGAPGEPVVLAHALGASPQTLHWSPDTSLVRRLHARGFDVYLLEHRGDRNALSSGKAGPCDLDAIVESDLPAALARVRQYSGHPRALWIGHGLGGQLLYAYLARGGAHDLAAGVTLGAPVRFGPIASRARLLARAARLLPAGLRLPARRLAQLAATAEDGRLAGLGLGRDLDGPRTRGLMVHGAADLPAELLQQAARWLESGTLCDRDDRFDYVAAIAGLRFPVLGVAAHGDPMGPPGDAWPALDALDGDGVERIELDDTWGHLDLLVGRRAEVEVMPAVVEYLDAHRRACLQDRGPAGVVRDRR